MPEVTTKIVAAAAQYLKRTGVPERDVPARLKQTGGRLILCSAALIVPLLTFEHVPVAAIVLLQLGYATLMWFGIALASESKRPLR